jgi:rod shape-determining protein MreC
MESFFSRYRNPMILGIVLLLQVFGLAVQLKRPIDPRHPEAGSVRMIRLWVSTVITPIERIFIGTGNFFRTSWHDYVNIRGLRSENEQLRAENEQLRLDQSRISEEAGKAQRLEQLLEFKQRFPIKTVAAQVIGSSGTEQSHLLLIDRGWRDGLRPDLAVLTPEGVVGKLRDVFPFTAQVLLISDATSGVGGLLESSRLHGVVKGTSNGALVLDHVMVDEKVERGDRVMTSGGDRVYPKGFPVGTVTDVCAPSRSRDCEPLLPGSDLFLNIRLKPAAELNRLEEVLVVTEPAPQQAETETPMHTADILAQRLPGVTGKSPENAADGQGTAAGTATGVQPQKAPGNPPQSTPGNMPAPANPKTTRPPLTTTPPAVPGATAPAGAARVKKPTGTRNAASPSAGTSAGSGSGLKPANTAPAPAPSGESAPPVPIPITAPTPTPTPAPAATPPASNPASNPATETPKLP